jgi:hypothetical protein
MAQLTSADFCDKVPKKHCGCMRLNTCASLAAKVVAKYKRVVPTGVGERLTAYRQSPTQEHSLDLCQAVFEDTDPDLVEFLQEYQEYASNRDIHALLERLHPLTAAQLNTCAALAVKVAAKYKRAVPTGVGERLTAYRKSATQEHSLALCQAVFEDTDPDLVEFLREYQEYTSNKDIHALLERLHRLTVTQHAEYVSRV